MRARCQHQRLYRLLLACVVALPLLTACGGTSPLQLAAVLSAQAQAANAAATVPVVDSMQGEPLPWDQIPPDAPCRIAAQWASTVQGWVYSQGGHDARDRINPATGQVYSRDANPPGSADCAGMTEWAYLKTGRDIGKVTKDQVQQGTEVPCRNTDLHGTQTTCWATSDLSFWYNERGEVVHVEMYWRDGIFAACLNWDEGCRVWARSPQSFPAHYDAVLADLDQLEGVNHQTPALGYYQRVVRAVVAGTGANARRMKAYVYQATPRVLRYVTDKEILPTGDWLVRQRG